MFSSFDEERWPSSDLGAGRLEPGPKVAFREAYRHAPRPTGAQNELETQRVGRDAPPRCRGNGPARPSSGHLGVAVAPLRGTEVGHDQHAAAAGPGAPSSRILQTRLGRPSLIPWGLRNPHFLNQEPIAASPCSRAGRVCDRDDPYYPQELSTEGAA
jgi:hypothetical protein